MKPTVIKQVKPAVILLSVLTAAAYLFSGSALAGTHENTPAKIAFKSSVITPAITVLQGGGGNIAVLSTDSGLIVVDTDYEKHAEILQQTLKKMGKTKPVRYAINTHWHGDHSGGNKKLGDSTPIIAHENVRSRLQKPQEISFFKMRSEAYPDYALPSLTYQKAFELSIDDQQIRLEHFPNAHTDGDSVVFFKQANLVHMGDLFFNGFFPFVDIDSGGNVVTLSQHIKTILEQLDDKTVVIPGHGAVGTKADLKAYSSMLEGTILEVKIMKKAGMSLLEMQKAGLSKKWEAWTKGFIPTDKWIEFVAESL